MTRRRLLMSEDDMLDKCMTMGAYFGWRLVHFRPALTGKGYKTALTGDAGWPDLFMVRPGEALAAEFKGPRTPIQPGQPKWIEYLDSVPGITAMFVRNENLAEFEALIKRPRVQGRPLVNRSTV